MLQLAHHTLLLQLTCLLVVCLRLLAHTGGFGIVYSGKDSSSGQPFAVKRLRVSEKGDMLTSCPICDHLPEALHALTPHGSALLYVAHFVAIDVAFWLVFSRVRFGCHADSVMTHLISLRLC